MSKVRDFFGHVYQVVMYVVVAIVGPILDWINRGRHRKSDR